MRRATACLLLAVAAWGGSLAAQPGPAQTPVPQAPVSAAMAAERAGEEAPLVFFNRPVVLFRARVLGREPADRAAAAVRVLDELIAAGVTGPVGSRRIEAAALISVGSRAVLVITPPDVEELAGETLDGVTEEAVARLRQALDEAAESRTPRALFRAAVVALVALAVGVLMMWGLGRTRRIAVHKLAAIAERTVAMSGIADLAALRSSRLLDLQRWAVNGVTTALQVLVVYGLVTFDLRLFPYTRPWGESLRGFLIDTVTNLGLGTLYAIPGLFTAALILLLARVLTRVLSLWFTSVERGRVSVSWLYPETAQPTRRLLTTLVWLFAVVVAYPYVPGSGTDAFKGVSVFLGLMLTFGSSGLVNQIMSGFMVTYSRAVRVGDFVRIGDVEGTVTHLGVLSTKIKTLQFEDVTIPNAVVVAQTTANYSRRHEQEGVFTTTSVTIGYDAPWRQVQALLLQAAGRTPGLRKAPAPRVYQRGLEDFYVKYELQVCLDHQESRLVTLDALHANIQDVFNEYGVQIMSPNYVFDPAAPKVVPKGSWFAAPARPDPPRREP